MTTLVVGASGATGKHLVDALLASNQKVKVIVRSADSVPESWRNNNQLTIIQASVSEISLDKMAEYVQDCDAVASCLGHNLNLKGIYGKPRELVTDTVKLLCKAINKNTSSTPVKFVLMNTSGNRNRDLKEPLSFAHRSVLAILRILLPPHVDNEKAADYLRTHIGQGNRFVEWVAVRPDTLVNEDQVSEYEVHPSPIRDPLFNAGIVSRINVAYFMAALILENELWSKWKGQMPVIYNVDQKKKK